MKQQLLAKARRWISKPENQAKLKRAARSAWSSYQKKRGQHQPGTQGPAGPRRRD